MDNMNNKTKSLSIFSPFIIIIFSALCIQLTGHYHARKFIVGDHFYASWVILRIIIPFFLIWLLKIPISRIGLGKPSVDKKNVKIIIFLFIMIPVIFVGIYYFQGYFNTYSGSFSSHGSGKLARFLNFGIFTASTLTGWEFLHRGFLLMGLMYVLTEKEGVHPETAIKMAVAVPWIFEVVFHFIKPELEAVGMLVGSPILSYIAIRTDSIWIPFFIHLFVEMLFICSLILR